MTAPRAGVRLLVVDDEEQILELLDLTLSIQGYEVCPAGSGPRALEVGRRDGSVERVTVVPAPTRPVSDLPAVFWFQLFAGGASLLAVGFLHLAEDARRA